MSNDFKPMERISNQVTAEEFNNYKKTGKWPWDESAKKKNKYRNVRKEVDGLKFDSTREANRFGELMLMHKAGLISKPVLQYEFQLVGCSYICDFLYLDYEKKQFIVEDSKGCRTDEFKIKAKQMLELYDIKILET